ncbi:MAG: DNA polymerase III subunit gamma/tau [Candidatus Peribacteria bacterium]|nr:MAG: DNA polymerase III subunit gamma/tau [Candidatus Peribacteria bacterium]
MNCLQPKEGNPCLECDICTQFQEERLVDIIEIDAASHTGVDNIREIIERAQFAPTKTKYKVYIIDEVHMLSKGAFNALLKILEEPPKHVKFILATTETHKVPETIISRCQRYDFKSISDTDIKERLQFIAKKEEITIDEPSLQYITKHSGGALRNAINLFEQLIIDNEISYTNIEANLGLLQEDFLASIYKKLQTKDASVIEDIESSIKNGANLKLFLKDLIWYIKDSILGEVKN